MTPKQTVAAFRKLLDEAEIATIHRASDVRMGTEVLYIPMDSGRITVLIDRERYELSTDDHGYTAVVTEDAEQAITYIREILSPAQKKEAP